jgi:malonyl CoA-acyl carrier protein transacylase
MGSGLAEDRLPVSFGSAMSKAWETDPLGLASVTGLDRADVRLVAPFGSMFPTV